MGSQRRSLAILAVAGSAVAAFAVSLATGPAIAAPLLAADPTTTTTTATGSTPPATTTGTPTPIDCTPVAPTVTSTTARATSLSFFVTSPSGYQCGVLRATTVTLYTTAAHTTVAASKVFTAGATQMVVVVDGLTASTTYYPVVGVEATGTPSTTVAAVTTSAAPTTSTSGPTTSTTTTYPCDYGGYATVSPISWTTSTAVLSYTFGGAYVSCAGTNSVFLTFYTDAAHTQAAVSTSTPSGAYTGALRASGFSPGTTYYGRWQVFGPLGSSGDIAPFTTVSDNTSTGTTTTTTGHCDTSPTTVTFLAATISSLDFSFTAPGAAQCGGGGITTVEVYRDAAHTSLAASASSTPGTTSGTLRVQTLSPGTTYYPVARSSNALILVSSLPPAATLPFGTTTTTTSTTTTTTTRAPSCAAVWKTLSAWPGGFLGEVTVKNTSSVASTGWTTSWTFSGAAAMTAAYNVTVAGTATSPVLSDLSWNAVITPGGSTTYTLLGTGAITPPSVGCQLR